MELKPIDVCKSKISYLTFNVAIEVIDFDNIGNAEPYKCKVCKKWHLHSTDEHKRKPRKNKFVKKISLIMKSKKKK